MLAAMIVVLQKVHSIDSIADTDYLLSEKKKYKSKK